ncbi:nuclear transport factor 2 family protein [Ulvibacter litoralis]|uniref:Putative lumazine-binding n=1 Tax=Ulvibacter litoralis TaxID=227084 RepID=A0A1G7HJB8_9FLAO|nr:nuclear transport factor 2 family protein [Ulvibacter litoralis]GHC58014.1 hypothetical protein GCM10008083_23330 [Ulvibacter litoralis]SDF00423.1 Putative lumazine-binding [Ulvibacter litoralis]
MKLLLLLLITFCGSTLCFSQQDFSEAEAKQIIATFFEGFHKGNTLQMSTLLTSHAMLETAFTNKEGVATITTKSASSLVTAIAKRPTDQQWEERILGYTIAIDGNLAHVWTPYEFWVNGTFSHCGANSFTIVKTNAGWKIHHIIDSRRQAGCQQE